MEEYEPEYMILNPEEIVPREQIQLIPESELCPFDKAELIRLREGRVTYRILVADTSKNRANIAAKTAYFQMVAYKEGWIFDPNKYQVQFVNPIDFSLIEKGDQKGIYELDENAEPEDLSPERRVGYTISQKRATRMAHEETDGLARKVINFFRGLKNK